MRAAQRWVWEGGSLLLITDHEPFGSASVALAAVRRRDEQLRHDRPDQ